jgi:hypothetical protein
MTAKPRRVALYLRVSTDGQSTAVQRRDLVEACKHRGWEVTEVYEDAGISGAKGREGRPAFDRLCQDAIKVRPKDTPRCSTSASTPPDGARPRQACGRQGVTSFLF